MKSRIPLFAGTAALILASNSFTQAASLVVDNANLVGVMNTNSHTIIDATGSISNSTFASNMATAFTNNTGAVWNLEQPDFHVLNGETITLSYGTSHAKSLVMTLSSVGEVNAGFVNSAEATSGSQGLGFGTDAGDRTFTLSTPLQTVGIFVGNRGDNSRTSLLTVTFLDNTTASTALGGANAGPAAGSNFFEGLSATGTNYIKSFTLTQSNFVRYDDLGFIAAVPEPASGALVLLSGAGMLGLVRHRRPNIRG